MLLFTTTNIVNTPGTWFVKRDQGDLPVKFRLNFGPEFWKDDTHLIKKIVVNKAAKAELATAKINLATLEANLKYRIVAYIRVVGSQQSTYANTWVFKGKLLNLGEFTFPTDTNGKRAENILENVIRKFSLAQYGEDLLKFSASGDVLTVMAKDQFQRFLTQDNEFGLVVEKLTNTTGSLVNPYEWEDVDAGKELTASNRVVKPKFLGKEAFGDYTHMVKDLRLPSAENRRWYGPAMGDVMGGEPNDDQPVYGTYYTQVTVTYEADRGLGQGDALGGLARSRTTHVFFVADSEPLEPGDSSTEGLIDEETLVGKFIADLEAVAGIGTAPIVPVATSKVGE